MKSTSIVWFKRLFLIFFLNFNLNSLHGQENIFSSENKKINDSISQLLIDPKNLDESEEAIFLKALGELTSRKQIYDTIKIKKSQTVNLIIKDNYNYDISKNFEASFSIQKIITDENKLDKSLSIKNGESLLIPAIPNKPEKSSKIIYAQVFDLVNASFFVSNTNQLLSLEEKPSNLDIKKSNAGLWVYNLSQSDLQELFKSIPIEMQRKLNGSAYIVINQEPSFVEINFPSIVDNDNLPIIPVLQNIPFDLLLKIKEKDFGKYYVLDFFNGNSCTHGQKVLSVINQRLREYHLDGLKIDIIPIPINYFQNQEFAIKFLENYYSSDKINPLEKLQAEKTIQFLKKLNPAESKRCENCIPEIFLDACIKFYYGSKPDIISTSFYMTAYRGIMPNFISPSTNLVTACLNEPGRTIESLKDRESLIDGTSNGAIEPLFSSWKDYSRTGSIIVGCQIDKNKFYGMYSNEGRGITSLGKGIGWESTQNCMNPMEKGASFATPDVAVKLLIAKAYWRSKGFEPLAIESRTRLLLSSDLESSFIGKFASAGQSNLSKLLMISDGYIEDNNGIVKECIITKSSFVEVDENSRFPFARGLYGISGLSIVDNNVCVFFESSMSWIPVNIKKIFITIVENGVSESFNSIEELKAKYKHLVILKT